MSLEMIPDGQGEEDDLDNLFTDGEQDREESFGQTKKGGCQCFKTVFGVT